MTKIAIIIGSTRPNRFGPQVGKWLSDIAQQRPDAEFTIIDLADVNLPLFDDPGYPSAGQHITPYAQAWAEQIAPFDGFLMVTPEYNHSTSGALKNALDYLYTEWNFKPVAFASYGSVAGGTRAVEHLRGIAAELKMYDLREQIVISNYWHLLGENGQATFGEAEVGQATAALDQLVFWSEQMATSRAALQARELVAAK